MAGSEVSSFLSNAGHEQVVLYQPDNQRDVFLFKAMLLTEYPSAMPSLSGLLPGLCNTVKECCNVKHPGALQRRACGWFVAGVRVRVRLPSVGVNF